MPHHQPGTARWPSNCGGLLARGGRAGAWSSGWRSAESEGQAGAATSERRGRVGGPSAGAGRPPAGTTTARAAWGGHRPRGGNGARGDWCPCGRHDARNGGWSCGGGDTARLAPARRQHREEREEREWRMVTGGGLAAR
ncbi:hypothetical protein PVAP13_5NG166581 [Panicum virgatum]|uniref:Uncharacterized protein n=1 Tax=Panicum virgatum TaxID=38727 RepID=A0A8T0RS93_PANVG|nr:hypothetical protein PVAP13_5NG166581 [Panicum virgatum]